MLLYPLSPYARKLWIFLISLGSIISSLQGQVIEKPQLVSIKFSVYASKKTQILNPSMRQENVDRTRILYYHDGNKWVRIKFPANKISTKQYRYQGFLPIKFYNRPIPPETLTPPKPVVEVDCPVQWKDLVIMFFPKGNSFETITVDRAATAIPPGSGRLYNIGRAPVAYRFGTEEGTLQPHQAENIKITATHGPYFFTQLAGKKENNQWELAYSSKSYMGEHQRAIFMALQPNRSKPDFWTLHTVIIPEVSTVPEEE